MESKYSILTPTGFQKFDGIIRNKKQSLLIKTRNGNSIETSLEHIFIVGGKEVKAKSLTPGDYITDKDRVVSSKLYKIQYLYDPVNVQNGNRYIGNGIIHHNCSFIGSSFTLISGDTLSKLSSKEYIWSRNDFNAIENPIPGHTYFIAVDTSEGVGGDNSAFVVIDITKMPYLTVGKFKCNTISYLLYPNIIQQFAKLYNNAFVLVEVNSIGNSVAQILYDELEYENILMLHVKNLLLNYLYFL
jgi:hypothetical protein